MAAHIRHAMDVVDPLERGHLQGVVTPPPMQFCTTWGVWFLIGIESASAPRLSFPCSS